MTRMHVAAGIAGILTFALAFLLRPVPERTLSPTSAVITTTTSVEPTIRSTTTTTETVVPPLHASDWDGLRRVWSELDAEVVWLYAHPTVDPAQLERVFDPSGPEYDEQRAILQDWADLGLHREGRWGAGEVLSFSCCPDPVAEMEDGTIQVELQTRWPDDEPNRLVDTSGTTRFEEPGWDLRTFSVILRRDEEGRWRIWSFASRPSS